MTLGFGTFCLLLFACLVTEVSADCPKWDCPKTCFVYKEDENGCPLCECKLDFEFYDDVKMYPALRAFMNAAFQTDASHDSPNPDVLHGGTTTAYRKWKNLPDGNGGWFIPYNFDSTMHDPEMIELIQDAIADLENFTCLTFVERTDQESYILFQDNSTSACWSYIGRLIPSINSGVNRINLRQRVPGQGSCHFKGIILHEIMHALGFFHEHQRPDRDVHVTINEANIIPGKEGNFVKLNDLHWDGFGSPYDLGSVMQYDEDAFSWNGLPTIEDKDGLGFTAQRSHLADSDIFQIRSMYECDGDIDECAIGTDHCSDNANCTNTNGSYICTCHEGYSGDGIFCLVPPDDLCGRTFEVLPGQTSTVNYLWHPDVGYPKNQNCTFYLGGTGTGQLHITFTSFELEFSSSCSFDYLQVYDGPSTSSHSLNKLCGSEIPAPIITTGNVATLKFFTDGSVQKTGFILQFANVSGTNECTTGTHNCSDNATCTNTLGSYTCVCNQGYSGDGVACNDINECTTGTDSCSNNAMCTNTVGSHNCTCDSGYSGNGVTCYEINECTAGTDSCSDDATCTNTIGSYTCTCNEGYSGDGFTCVTTTPRVCEDKLSTNRCEKKRRKGQCFTRANLMKRKCELTCRFCDCEDLLEDCATRKSNGDCYSSSLIDFMKAKCPITCGFCRKGCFNTKGVGCRNLANNGDCQSNFDYMALHCRKRCKHCITSNV